MVILDHSTKYRWIIALNTGDLLPENEGYTSSNFCLSQLVHSFWGCNATAAAAERLKKSI